MEMATEIADDPFDRLSSRLCEELRAVYSISSNKSIIKVPEFLRNVNEEAYEPRMVAIGPFHRGKPHLIAMENRKMYSLKTLLHRKGQVDVRRYISIMRELEPSARAEYEDPTDLSAPEFVRMMLLDACFIVELLRQYATHINYIEDNIEDNIEDKVNWFMNIARRDLLLVENQIPLFVLQKFFDQTTEPGERPLCKMILDFFRHLPVKPGTAPEATDDIKNILGLLHNSWKGLLFEVPTGSDCWKGPQYSLESRSTVNSENDEKKYNGSIIPSATELQEAGISFRPVEFSNPFDIKFRNGIMMIRPSKIDKNSESFFRNLIAYEQFRQMNMPEENDKNVYVIDYVIFMDCLVNTSKDVEILCQHGIIENTLGDNELLANMFNRLGDDATLFPSDFVYRKLFDVVNNHYRSPWTQWKRRRTKWIAELWNQYFSSPWAFISFLAAFILLALTVMQTVYAVRDYNNSSFKG